MGHLAGKMRHLATRALQVVVWLAAVAVHAIAPVQAAGDGAVGPDAQSAFWAGADASGSAWSLYAGSENVFCGRMDEAGWRMRAGGGHGQYSYSGAVLKPAAGGGTCDATTVKVFGGGDGEHHTIPPFDPCSRLQSEAYGLELVGELWQRFSEVHWLAGHASYSTTFNTYKLEGRSDWRVLPELDLGLEARVEGNGDYDGGRAGAFAMLRIGTGALTTAAGVEADRDMHASPYATVGFFMRY